MKKKTILLGLLLSSSLVLAACSQNSQTGTAETSSSTSTAQSSSSSSSSSTESSSSENTATKNAAGKSSVTYSDGSTILVDEDGETFTVTLKNGDQITYSAEDGEYSILQADGTNISKDGDGEYSIASSTGITATLESDGSYNITGGTAGVESGNGRADLNTKLTANGLSTLDDYDKKVQDLVDYIAKNS